MIFQLFLAILGLALLYFGAEWLVGGSSRLAFRLGVSPLIVGLTVVAFGTSSPELLVCLHANLSATDPTAGGGFVMGNIIGSNIYNIALILAVGALIRPILVSRQVIFREGPFLIGMTLLLLWFVRDFQIDRIEGGVFVALLLSFLVLSGITSAKQMRASADDETPEDEEEMAEAAATPLWKLFLLIVIGLVGLAGGAQVLVSSATKLALMVGVPEAFVSLTIVAFGTSVPELATVVVASMRKQGDIITGNVIGSNIFNTLAILGITALAKPVVYDSMEVRPMELYYMSGVTVLLLPLLITRRRLARWEGGILLLSCLIYTGFLVQRLPSNTESIELETASLPVPQTVSVRQD
jgi:cation:H+ antiporter